MFNLSMHLTLCLMADCSAACASSKELDNGWLFTRAWCVWCQRSISTG